MSEPSVAEVVARLRAFSGIDMGAKFYTDVASLLESEHAARNSAENELLEIGVAIGVYYASDQGSWPAPLPDVLKRLRELTEAERELAELRGLARFWLMLFDRSRDEAWCGDVDAVDVQNYALECGLIEPRVVKEPCGANGCPCGPGDECFWETEAMAKARQRVAIVRIGDTE